MNLRTGASSKNRKLRAIPLCTWRYYTMLAVFAVAFTALLGRAAWLQVVEAETLNQAGDQRAVRIKGIDTRRGLITDRNGEELARSVPVKSLWLDPATLYRFPELFSGKEWQQLAAALKKPVAELNDWLEQRKTRRFVWLRRQLDPRVALFIERLKLPGVHLKKEYRRYYPTAEVNAHLVGFTGIDDQGIEGMERAYNGWLTNTPGEQQVVMDLQRRVVAHNGVLEAPRNGKDLTLSIDSRVQAIAYRALKTAVTRHKAKGGSVVVLDAHTFEVMAMANQPAFNPNRLEDRDPALARNRAVTDLFEPGSTAKPLSVISALASGNFQLDSIVDTSPGRYRLNGAWVRDPRNYGPLDIAGVLKKSSNVGVSRMALSLSDPAFLETFQRVGFGEDTGSGFPGETSGRFSPRHNWADIEKATFSYGYGFQVSAVQLARAYGVLATGGLQRPVSLLKLDEVPTGEQVLDRTIVKQVVKMMEQVVEPGGTAPKARIPGYRVAGKTGTARKAVVGGYGDEYVNIFAGLAPASDPELVVVVVVDEPGGDAYHGGTVAAPVFAEVMESSLRLLNIAPDKTDFPENQLARLGGGDNHGG